MTGLWIGLGIAVAGLAIAQGITSAGQYIRDGLLNRPGHRELLEEGRRRLEGERRD